MPARSTIIRARARGRDRRPTLPQSTPSVSSESIAATFAEQIAVDQAELAGTVPTERALRGLPAASFVVNRIANAVASMSPLGVLEADGKTKRTPTPLVAHRPLPTLGIFDYWHLVITHALMRGNFVGLPLDFDEGGYPRQVLPINADFVNCYVDAAGFTVYDILGAVFSLEEVVHVRGPYTIPGNPWAMSPAENFRQAIGGAVDVQTYGSAAYREGSVPSAVIALDVDEVKATVAQQVRADWIVAHGGVRRPAVVPRTMTITPLSWSPHDAEFIESRKLSIAECALMFDTDPADIGVSIGGQSMTYANISARQTARIVETYGPWMRRFEEAWSDLVAGDAMCKFEPEQTMRLTALERAQLQETRLRSGVSTIDEERELEGRGPKPKTDPPPAPPAPVPDELEEAEQQ